MPIISPPKKSVNFNIEEEMYPLIEMLEAESCMTILMSQPHCFVKQNWYLIKGTWNPLRNNVTIPHGDAQWTVRVDVLIQRIIIHFQGRAD